MSIKVFISWSGNESKFVASQLRTLIKLTCAATEPWISRDDLEPGVLWHNELMKQLHSTRFGIICINRANLNSRWIHFEAGALAKSLDSASVYPYLIDLPYSDLPQPLAMYQAVSADKAGTFKLIAALNKILRNEQETFQTDDYLQTLFEQLWPDYERKLEQSHKVPLDAGPERSNTEILGELLEYARAHSRVLGSLWSANPTPRRPIQITDPASTRPSDEDLLRFRFEELRHNAMNLRRSGQYEYALNLFHDALTLRPGDLETLIDIAVTETYLPHSPYEESIRKLEALVQEHATSKDAPLTAESIIAKAYYNLACIKKIAWTEQDKPYSGDDILDDLECALINYQIYADIAMADSDLIELRENNRFKELIKKYRRGEP